MRLEQVLYYVPKQEISIHASREGCDNIAQLEMFIVRYFNPRIPRGMRLCGVRNYILARSNFNPRIPRGMRLPTIKGKIELEAFQSTHPARDATMVSGVTAISALFQSTHPARDATLPEATTTVTGPYFNPRIPRGMRRPRCKRPSGRNRHFNPRIPRGMRLGKHFL